MGRRSIEEQNVTQLEDVMKILFNGNEEFGNAQLSKRNQARIEANNRNFCKQKENVKMCLQKLNLPEKLMKFLVWIPYDRFGDIKTTKRHADIYQAIILSENDRGFACHRNPDEPDSTDIYYDYEKQREYTIKKYHHNTVLRNEVLNSVLISAFSNLYDAVAPIGFTWDPNDQLPSLVSEVSDDSLADWLEKNPTLPWKEVWRFADRLARELLDIHRLGIAHGNLRPENVAIAGETFLPYIVNIEYYYDPSNVGDVFDKRASDVYCMGNILWQLVATVPPHNDRLGNDSIPGVPEAYENIYRECWNLNGKTSPSAQQIVTQLVAAENNVKTAQMSEKTIEFVEKRRQESILVDTLGNQTLSTFLPRSDEISQNDDEEFRRIENMTIDEFTSYERENRDTVKRYKEYLEREHQGLQRKNDELTEMEKRLNIEVKRAFPLKWLHSLLGIHVRDLKVGESSATSQSEVIRPCLKEKTEDWTATRTG